MRVGKPGALGVQILLINAPVARSSPHSRLAPPLGLAYIASTLLLEGHEVSAVDFNVSGLNLRRVDRIVGREKPGIVGISAHTETYPNGLEIAKRVKGIDPSIKVVMGGPHPTILPKRVLQEEAVDFVVIGEGEMTMLELANYIGDDRGRLEDIKGLAYKDGGIEINERRELLDPDGLPHPIRQLFPIEFYHDKWNVLTARGSCPFKCPFCSASAIWEGRRRARDPTGVIGEIRVLIERCGASYVFFADDIFTLDRKWVYELLGLLNGLAYRLEWGCATRVDLVDRELLRDMADAGCRAIQYGVESGSQRILDSAKGINKDQILEAVLGGREAGIDIASSFMIPFPEDTRESIRETKEFIKEVHKAGSKILMSYTTPYPGTHLYEHADELGVKILADRWDEFDAKHNVMETKYLSSREIDEFVAELVKETGLRRAI
jgi:anaerobic magnesium-protoporphyrin IX monomethyl ester cyclase